MLGFVADQMYSVAESFSHLSDDELRAGVSDAFREELGIQDTHHPYPWWEHQAPTHALDNASCPPIRPAGALDRELDYYCFHN